MSDVTAEVTLVHRKSVGEYQIAVFRGIVEQISDHLLFLTNVVYWGHPTKDWTFYTGRMVVPMHNVKMITFPEQP